MVDVGRRKGAILPLWPVFMIPQLSSWAVLTGTSCCRHLRSSQVMSMIDSTKNAAVMIDLALIHLDFRTTRQTAHASYFPKNRFDIARAYIGLRGLGVQHPIHSSTCLRVLLRSGSMKGNAV